MYPDPRTKHQRSTSYAKPKDFVYCLDARTLAHLLRSDLVAECYIASSQIREDRLLLRLRINLVQDRTRVMYRVHSLLEKYDVKCIIITYLVQKEQDGQSLKLSDNDQFVYKSMSCR